MRVFSCDNSKTKNCSGQVEIASPASGCTVALSGDDPFPAGDASPQDTQATCTIDAADFAGLSLGIVDVCSYTSSSPSSVASDCVLFVPECTIDADCSDSDACNGAEVCTAGACEPGTPLVCDNGAFCDGTEICVPATGCVAGTAPCSGTECNTCQEATDSCFDPSDTGCGSGSDTVCDNPDTCDGAGTCQPNVEPGTLECRGVAGTCDVAETCDGAGSCPADEFVAAATECAAATGDCDVAEACTGRALCPADGNNLTSVCAAATGVCDAAEFCSDASDDCPADGDNLTSACRSSGVCDPAEFCSNASDDCPTDLMDPPGEACGDQSDNFCTDPDTCNENGFCEPNNEACAAVTNSLLCTFDVSSKGVCVDGNGIPDGDVCDTQTGDPSCDTGTCVEENQFRLLFTPDGRNWPAHKLTASNPGQFYYNLFSDASTQGSCDNDNSACDTSIPNQRGWQLHSGLRGQFGDLRNQSTLPLRDSRRHADSCIRRFDCEHGT